MQGEEQPQPTEAEAQPVVLDYAKPVPPSTISFPQLVFWLSACHLVVTAVAVILNDAMRSSYGVPPLIEALYAIVRMPLYHPVESVVSKHARAMGGFGIIVGCLANSLFWGFAIAFPIHWLKRRRMRRM